MTESPQDERLDGNRTKPRLGDRVFSLLSLGSGSLIFVTLALVAAFLTIRSLPAIQASREATGDPSAVSLVETAAPLLFGTVLAAFIALLVAVPISLGIALFISHVAPRRLSTPIGFMVDLLAAVPSVVFGLWGGVWLVPRMESIYMALNRTLGQPDISLFGAQFHLVWPSAVPWIGGEPLFFFFAGEPTAPMRNMASAGLVLAVMVVPIITAISREIFLQTPRLTEEAALALGATRLEMIKTVVLPFGRSGMISASMLGLGRALGETMAVLMVLSPGATFSPHIFVVGLHNTIAANIASQSAEAGPDVMSRLIFTGLILFAITFVINALARLIVSRRKTA